MFANYLEKHHAEVEERALASPHILLPNLHKINRVIIEFIKKVGLLMSSEDSGAVKVYSLYGSHAFQKANDLANLIATETIHVQLNTDVVNREFTIVVDGFYMVHIFDMSARYISIMMPQKDTQQIAPEIELMDIYHRLYSPQFYSDWDDIGKHERCLWKKFEGRRSLVIRKAVVDGGVVLVDHSSIVMEWLRGQESCAIIGSRAIDMMRKETRKTKHRTIQLVASNPQQTIKSLEQYLSNTFPTINVRSYDAMIPNDFRLKKYVVSVKSGGRTIYIANIYNSARYELVPYIDIGDYRLVAPIAQMRFLLVDLWFARFLKFSNTMPAKMYESVAKTIISDMCLARDMLDSTSLRQFIGTHVSEIIAKKNMNTPYPYYPAWEKKSRGKYRKIT
jgi:hypothetical protein